jgi:hypothetical protein
MLKLAIFIVQDRHAAWVRVQRRTSTAFDPGSAAATPLTRVPFHLNGSLAISCGANNQKVAVILA